MKALSALIVTAALAGSALAQGSVGPAGSTEAPRGGFSGPVAVVTVEQAKALADDAPVTLRGTIERHLGGERYQFKDASGTMAVDIDPRRWQEQSVSPTDMVEIHGEVEKKRQSTEIEVKSLRRL